MNSTDKDNEFFGIVETNGRSSNLLSTETREIKFRNRSVKNGTEKIVIYHDCKVELYTGFKDANDNEIYENDILEYVDVWQPRLKQVKVEFNELVGAWYAGTEMLCNLLIEQHNDEWKKSHNFKPNQTKTKK